MALANFDPKTEKAQLAKRTRQIRDGIKIGKRNFSAAGKDFNAILDVVEKLQLHLEIEGEERMSRERQLIADLESGRLIAIGFPTPKGSKAQLEIVPPFLFERRYFKFGKSEISDGEYRFAKVKIALSNAMQKPKIGRPSIKKYVFEIAELFKNEIYGLRPSEQARVIHNNGSIMFPELFKDSSPTNRAIERHLRTFWNTY